MRVQVPQDGNGGHGILRGRECVTNSRAFPRPGGCRTPPHPTSPRPHVQSSCRCLAKKKIPEGAERNAVRRLLKTVQWQEHLEYSTASLT